MRTSQQKKKENCNVLLTNYKSVVKPMGYSSTQTRARLQSLKDGQTIVHSYSWHKHTQMCSWICLPWKSDDNKQQK